MKALLQSLQVAGDRGLPSSPVPDVALACDEDALSVAASGTFFHEGFPDLSSQASGSDSSNLGVFQRAACLLVRFWFSQPMSVCRVLAAMQDASRFGMGQMPTVEPGVTFLIVPPDKALRASVHCPQPQCRLTDDHGPDWEFPLPSVAGSLVLSGVCVLGPIHSGHGGCDPAGLCFHDEVWLAQSPLTECCRRTLRVLPVVAGELFDTAALEALERTAQGSCTWQQLVGLHQCDHQPLGTWIVDGPPSVAFWTARTLDLWVLSTLVSPGQGVPTPAPSTWQGVDDCYL
ncbi:hypothetical protein CRENBAI_000346 [Crenichthys baileyi]|uniref:Uncharacterized protein n=1 Tax=Crenichthys baileyi TaxID=28760 RepID=A0AAV9QTA4_9TELE